jgi:hypothetical protein
LIAADREWKGADGASPELLESLRKVLPVDLPPEYSQLLAFSNGGEGSLSVPPYNFCLDDGECAAKQWADKLFEEFFPGFFVIGSNGAGEAIAFDMRGSKPWPLIAFDMTDIDRDESVMAIAPDFVSFLDLVGLAPPEEELEWSPTLESRVPSAEAATRVDDDALYEVLDDENAIWTLYGGTRGTGSLRVVLKHAQ